MDVSPRADASVRLARTSDVDDIAQVQAASWEAAYAGSAVGVTLAALDPAGLAAAWGRAILAPPAPGCRVLVALEGPDVVGFAAIAPSADPDGSDDGELVALHVHPGHQRRGHGSRLLAAAMDYLRGDGSRGAVAWIPVDDEARRAFLLDAGWGPDGARRDLAHDDDPACTVREVRLATALADETPG